MDEQNENKQETNSMTSGSQKKQKTDKTGKKEGKKMQTKKMPAKAMQEKDSEEKNSQEKNPDKKTESKKGNGQKDQSVFLKQIPAYIVVLFLVAGVLGGIVFGILLQPPKEPPVIIPPGPIDDGPAQGKLKATLLVDENCTVCAKHNTILDVFENYGIEFDVNELSIHSPEGIKAIAEYQVKIIPTALVGVLEVTNYPELEQAMDQSFAKIRGKYVVPELNLVAGKIYSREYLTPPAPEDCNALDSKVRVNIFDDPFHELSIKQKLTLHSELEGFDKNDLQIRFEFLPTQAGSTLDANEFQKTSLFNRNIGFFVCSSQQEKFLETHDAMLGYYCDQTGNPATFADEELLFCNKSPHFRKLLTDEELDEVRARIGFFANLIESCAELTEIATSTSLQRAIDYSIRVPHTAVVACKYNVPFQAIAEAVCLADSEIEECIQTQG